MTTIDTEYTLAVGLYDLPAEAKSGVAYIYPLRSNTVVLGTAMSGKTTVIKSLLLRIHGYEDEHLTEWEHEHEHNHDNEHNHEHTTEIENIYIHKHTHIRKPVVVQEEVYILDFGGNLGRYADLNVVCACFDGSNAEDVKRLFKTIDSRLKENAQHLRDVSYRSMYESDTKKCPPHITLIIDNVNSMLSEGRYDNYFNKLLLYSRDGLSKGLSVIITANNTSNMGRLISNFAQKIVFPLSDGEYGDIFNNVKVKITPKKIPGRGFINIDSNICEFQGYLPLKNERIELDEKLKLQQPAVNPKRLISFPYSALTEKNFNDYVVHSKNKNGDNALPVVTGLDYYTHNPVEIDISVQRSIAIYGKRGFGKSNLLKQLVKGICSHESELGKIRFICLDDGRKALEDPELCTLFPENSSDEISERYFEKFTNLKTFNDYLSVDYGGIGIYATKNLETNTALNTNSSRQRVLPPINPNNPFTVFILQSKAIYQNDSNSQNFEKWYSKMVSDAISNKCLFIFSDVKPMTESSSSLAPVFNNSISVMFILDNIADFVSGRGKKSAVASYMEESEFKKEFADCSLGDGYFYDIEADVLQKLKYIKYEEEELCKYPD